ncbi:MAG: NAD(+) kinase [Cyanobacteria bacterium P01_D01_bin.123]
MQLRQVAIAYKESDRVSKAVCERCAEALRARHITVLTAPTGMQHNPYPVFLEAVEQPLDLAIVLGGDGSTLAAARHLSPSGVPILSIKAGGHLGFLAQSVRVLEDAPWDRLVEDDFSLQSRMMLRARILNVDGNAQSDDFFCLNEICVKPVTQARLPASLLEIEVDGEIVDQYHGDGLLVATPTGTTSYTVAASGPIIAPGLEAITITPICPLSLASRPIVIGGQSRVQIWPLADGDGLTRLWTDGLLARSVNPGENVEVQRADCSAQFVMLERDVSYFRTLREKLQWAGTRIHIPTDNHRVE